MANSSMQQGISCISGLILLFTSCESVSAQNYLDYYRAIAVAESAVVSGQYAAAVQQYETICSRYPYNNPSDCYVAAQVASSIGDTARCRSFLTKGISFGLPLPSITANPYLQSYVQGTGVQGTGVQGTGAALSPACIDSCWKAYLHAIDQKARAMLITLIRRDQSVVLGLPKRESIYDQTGNRLKQRYRPLWDSLLDEIIQLTRNSGFPAQKVTGTQTGDDGLFRIGPNSTFAYYILVHHGHAWPRIGAMLWEELQKGNITPQMYGAIAEYSNRDSLAFEERPYMAVRGCEAVVSRRACERYLHAHRQQIDSARHAIGLCSYEVMQQKDAATRQYHKWLRQKTKPDTMAFDFPSLSQFAQ